MAINRLHRAGRLVAALGFATCIALVSAAPAVAKMPYFSVEIVPSQPIAGQAIQIDVRTWQDAAHTIPAPFDVPDLHGLLVLRSADPSANSVGVPLHAETPGHFQGVVVVPTAGEWTLVAFPDRSGWSSPEIMPGYPDTISVTVQPETDAMGSVLAISGTVGAVSVAGLGWVVLRSHRRRSHAALHSPTSVALISAALLFGATACTMVASSPDANVTPSAHAFSPSPSPIALADGEDCPTTAPTAAPPEIGDQLFGSGSAHGNDDLWVGGLWPDGIIAAGDSFVAADGSIGMKFGWWRNVRGELEITGRRLDGSAPPLHAGVPDGYGQTGFQASGVSFPTEGCWEVTGRVGTSSLTFVTLVIREG